MRPNKDEETKLSERLARELPHGVKFLWDSHTGSLTFKTFCDDKLILTIGYGYPAYPLSEDAEFLVRRVKTILKV
ncbi:hypothetical protein GMLC_10850 [Geomonas limicola]|uniref:Uncharacterized protein n=1 Tax=Geomonas limicola TaxID=2740186 RepID=A0A6V8N4R2_9BACT|nr:hypothetical protein GMLC_10850 [Geomonas limicola]